MGEDQDQEVQGQNKENGTEGKQIGTQPEGQEKSGGTANRLLRVKMFQTLFNSQTLCKQNSFSKIFNLMPMKASCQSLFSD